MLEAWLLLWEEDTRGSSSRRREIEGMVQRFRRALCPREREKRRRARMKSNAHGDEVG